MLTFSLLRMFIFRVAYLRRNGRTMVIATRDGVIKEVLSVERCCFEIQSRDVRANIKMAKHLDLARPNEAQAVQRPTT
jgi:hypothetical protein